MNLHVLFGVRKDDPSAPPEATEVVDNYTLDTSPEVLDQLLAKQKALKNYDALAWFKVQLPERATREVRDRLTGTPLIVAATIEAVS